MNKVNSLNSLVKEFNRLSLEISNGNTDEELLYNYSKFTDMMFLNNTSISLLENLQDYCYVIEDGLITGQFKKSTVCSGIL